MTNLTKEQKDAILDAGHRVVLDGTADHKQLVTPFDAHEQQTRGEHIPTGLDTPDVHPDDVEEYPKAIAHDEKTGEPLIATSPEHEKQLKADLADKEKAEKAAKKGKV